jgi:molecular chaperone GrpE
LLGLLDLRDRLQAGADASAFARSSVFARFLAPGPTRLARSLTQGTQLTLQRLDDLLASHRVRPIEALGQALDPQTMCAVAIESVSSAAEGIVLREARRGFTHGGELLRAAEVIVNKKATQT